MYNLSCSHLLQQLLGVLAWEITCKLSEIIPMLSSFQVALIPTTLGFARVLRALFCKLHYKNTSFHRVGKLDAKVTICT